MWFFQCDVMTNVRTWNVILKSTTKLWRHASCRWHGMVSDYVRRTYTTSTENEFVFDCIRIRLQTDELHQRWTLIIAIRAILLIMLCVCVCVTIKLQPAGIVHKTVNKSKINPSSDSKCFSLKIYYSLFVCVARTPNVQFTTRIHSQYVTVVQRSTVYTCLMLTSSARLLVRLHLQWAIAMRFLRCFARHEYSEAANA